MYLGIPLLFNKSVLLSKLDFNIEKMEIILIDEDNKEDEEDYDETPTTDDTLDVGGNYGEKPQGGEGGEYDDF